MKLALILLASLFSMSSLADVPPQNADSPAGAKPWANESEVGVIVSKGNTDVETYSGKSLTTYKLDRSLVSFTGFYLNSFANDTEQAKAWSLGLKWEHELSPRFSGFIAQSVDGDRFQAIRQRYNSDVGMKYYAFKEENDYWFTEAGYRFTRENRETERLSFHKLRAYTEAEKKFGTGTSARLGIEFLPNLTLGRDWQLNGTASVSAIMSSVFSLKTAYVLRFDNEPAPGVAKKTDHTVTSAIVAKF